jgi:hypothetical protein
MTEIDKIKFHIRLLSEAIDFREHPIASLVISNDWTDADLDAAHDIFEKFDKKLEQKEDINWYGFEREFKDRFAIGYQGLKSVVLAFFWNGQWTSVCQAYAQEHQCVEFSEIIRGQHQHFYSALEERVAAILIANDIPYSRESAMAIGNNQEIIFDFVASLSRAKVAIEVSSMVNERALSKIKSAVDALPSSHIANEFWVIVDSKSPKDALALESIEGIKLFTIDEFEQQLR